MPNVREIMTRSLLTAAPTTPIEEVALGLTEAGIDGVPVRDDGGRLLGVVSKSDLADPSRMGEFRKSNKTAADVMSPVVFAIKDEEEAIEAARRMVDTGAHRLVVVDDAEQVVGIITPMDVMRALVDGKL